MKAAVEDMNRSTRHHAHSSFPECCAPPSDNLISWVYYITDTA